MKTNTRPPVLISPLVWAAGLFAVLVIGAGLSRTADAMQACGDHAAIVDNLAVSYEEFRSSVMVDSQGNLVEVYSNLDTGTWTLLMTRPRGGTCVISSGGNFVNTVSEHVVGEPA